MNFLVLLHFMALVIVTLHCYIKCLEAVIRIVNTNITGKDESLTAPPVMVEASCLIAPFGSLNL